MSLLARLWRLIKAKNLIYFVTSLFCPKFATIEKKISASLRDIMWLKSSVWKQLALTMWKKMRAILNSLLCRFTTRITSVTLCCSLFLLMGKNNMKNSRQMCSAIYMQPSQTGRTCFVCELLCKLIESSWIRLPVCVKRVQDEKIRCSREWEISLRGRAAVLRIQQLIIHIRSFENHWNS